MFYSIGHAKLKYDWGVKLLEMLKYGTIELRSYIVQKENIRFGLGFLS